MRFVGVVSMVAALAFAGPALAQTVGKDSIIQSLTPKITTRGIRMAASRPAASLLVLFDSGSADLTGDGRAQLDQLGAALQDPALKAAHFRIEGHTDTTGPESLNQALSAQRANAVADYLASHFGVERGRLVPVGLGKQGLAIATPDQTPEPRNRRVVIVNLDG